MGREVYETPHVTLGPPGATHFRRRFVTLDLPSPWSWGHAQGNGFSKKNMSVKKLFLKGIYVQ